MKIDDANGHLPTPPGATTGSVRAAGSRPADSIPTGAARPNDRVSLSDMLRSLASPANAPIDAEKVDKLRAAIASGSFRIDAQQIADGVITVSRDLLGTDRSSR